MEETNQPQPQKQKSKDKEAMRQKWLLCLTIVLVVVMLLALGYMWWLLKEANDREDALKKTNQALQAQIGAAEAEADAEELACDDTASAAMKENIKAALDTENTQPFSTYTADPVKVVFAGTEQGGDETPDAAAVLMDYTHTATGPWDFNLPQATLDKYEAGFYKDYFDENTYVGKAASGMVAAFEFDCNGKIDQIFIAANEDLLL